MGGSDYHEPTGNWSNSQRAVFGTIAGMVATALFHPLDRIKARIQVHPMRHSSASMAREIIRCEGYYGFYRGLTAALLRQTTNTTTRFSVYNWLYDNYKRKYDRPPSMKDRINIGVVAGLAGAMAGSPSEVVLVRMMASSSPRPYCLCTCLHIKGAVERPYENAADAIVRIVREEGWRTLWRGGALTVSRSVIISIAHISMYAVTRDTCCSKKHVGQSYMYHMGTLIVAIMLTSLFSLPIDIVKTRYQRLNSDTGITQQQVLRSLIARRGIRNIWRGFLPYFARLTLHSAATFVMLEEVNAIDHGI